MKISYCFAMALRLSDEKCSLSADIILVNKTAMQFAIEIVIANSLDVVLV